jgi:predicted  nucleic acid-binding Zn-ribbon protein
MYHHLIQRFKQACLVTLCCLSIAGQGQAQETNQFTMVANQSIALSRHDMRQLEDGRVILRGALQGQTNAMRSVEAYYPARNQFIKLGDLNLPRALEAMAQLPGGGILIASGSTTGSAVDTTAQCELFNPYTGGSIFVGPVNIARTEATATELFDGNVLLTGGRTSSLTDVLQAEVYNLTNSTFQLVGSMNAPRRMSTATLMADGRVLFVGGLSSGSGSSETYNPATGQFTAAGNLNVSRWGHAATILPDGRVLITGGELGVSPGGRLASAEIFDPATQTFTVTGSMTTGRRGHRATLLADGTVLITGGLLSNSTFAASTEIYHPQSGTFTTNVPMYMGRFNHQAIRLHDGRVLIPGGASGTNSRTAEVYDPTPELRLVDPASLFDTIEYLTNLTASLQFELGTASNTITGLTITNSNLQSQLAYANQTIAEIQPNPFRLLPDTLPPRPRIHTFTLPDGRVLMLGGVTIDVAATRSVGVFNPQTEVMTTAGGINEPRAGHTANLLPNGQILVAGGSIRTLPSLVTVVTNTTEIYSLSTSNSVPGPSMAFARIAAGSVNLADGRILVFAGRNDTTPFVAQSEIYEPTNGAFRLSGVMPVPVSIPTVTLLQNGRVLIYGSTTNTAPVIQVFDPVTETFHSLTGPSIGRIGHQASLLANGKVLISGGRAAISGQILNTTEIFDPVTETFSAGPNMLIARQNAAATTLPDGTVLVTGGQTNTSANFPATVQAELFNPANSTFSSAGVMATNQYFHAGVLLNNGTVLLTGGMSGVGPGLLFKEQLYDPTTHVRTSVFNNLSLLVDDLEAANADLSNQLASVQAALANANTTISGLVVTNAQLQQELADCQAEKAALITQINTLTNQVAQQQTTIITLGTQVNLLTNTVAQQQATIITLGTQVNLLTNQVATLTAQNNALTNQVAQLQSTVSSLQTQNNALTNQVATLTSQNQQLQSALTAEQANSQALTAQVAQQQALIASLQAQNTTLTTANQQLQTQVTGTQTQVNVLNSAFQSEFSDPTFVIPGATLQEQVQNLIQAILDLNHGQRKAVYNNLD